MLMIMCVVSGCGLVQGDGRGVAQPSDTAAPPEFVTGPVRPQPRPDTAEVATPAVAAPEVSVGPLGRSIASLGNAAEPGLWLKTPLVGATRSGRVQNPKTGQSVTLTLIPIEGPDTAGSRMSLAAMQAIGAPLTDLIEVDVFGI